MPSSLLPIGICVTLILLIEGILWHIFAKRVQGLHFPHEVDASFFRFFSMRRMRTCAIAHAVFLIALCSLILWFLW